VNIRLSIAYEGDGLKAFKFDHDIRVLYDDFI